jgi:septum formation protein
VPEFIANNKFEEAKKLITKWDLLITADTTVIIDNEILNKPQNFEEAFKMLSKLSGQKHEVVTGVCIGTQDKQISFSDKTDVYFENLTADEINYYIKTCKPYDKAGSYGIQEFIGYIGIKKIEGCFYNVMGLPIRKVYQTLKTF